MNVKVDETFEGCLSIALTELAALGKTNVGWAGIVDLRLTFTNVDEPLDGEKYSSITMKKHFSAELIPTVDGTWFIEDITKWEETIEVID